jgi:hypothetical protein
MARYTNADIKEKLGDLRSKIRDGKVTLYFRTDKDALRKAVAFAFDLQDPDAFNTENFNSQTLVRFAKLFDIPKVEFRYPSQDDAAWALQNFINRRANPWAHVTGTPDAVLATEASPINV